MINMKALKISKKGHIVCYESNKRHWMCVEMVESHQNSVNLRQKSVEFMRK